MTRHYLCDYEIEKKGKVVKSGTIQFARVNAPEDEDEDEAFAEASKSYGKLKLKRETFKQVVATKVPTNEIGEIVDRPTVLEVP